MGNKEDLEKELTEYLSGRKKKKIDIMGAIKGLMPKPTPLPVQLPPEIETYGEPEEKPANSMLIEEADPESLEEEITGRKKSIWQSIIEKIKFKPYKKKPDKKDLQIEEVEEARIKEMVAKELMIKDMRDLAKITLYVIKQMPPQQLKEFRESTDWTDLKEILKKYKFIK